eukprot:4350736-Prymnesium_polylepis.1
MPRTAILTPLESPRPGSRFRSSITTASTLRRSWCGRQAGWLLTMQKVQRHIKLRATLTQVIGTCADHLVAREPVQHQIVYVVDTHVARGHDGAFRPKLPVVAED